MKIQFWQGIFWLPVLRKVYAAVPKRLRETAFLQKLSQCFLDERFFCDAMYRTEILLYPGFAVNIIYAVMQLLMGIFYQSVWSGALAVYFVLLAVMRVYLLQSMQKSRSVASQWRQYRLCGGILLGMVPIFASILILVVHKNSGARYPGLLIVVMSVWAVCITVSAISNMVKFRKYQQPAISAAKIISLIAALMSVLSLSTALMDRIGKTGNAVLRQGIVGTAGGAVCVIVLTMAIFMVARSSKILRQEKVSNSFNKPIL